MHHKVVKVDNSRANPKRYHIGGIPAEEIREMLKISEPWIFLSAYIVDFEEEPEKEEDEKKSDEEKDGDEEDKKEEKPRSRGEITFTFDVRHGLHWPCPICNRECWVHQYETRLYRTIPYMRYRTWIEIPVPKIRCENCDKYIQIAVPWARPRVRYTIELERLIIDNLDDRSILSTGRYLDILDGTVSDVLKYRVTEALAKLDLSVTVKLYIDETSFRKGHRYITVIWDQKKRIIFACEGKDSGTIDQFCEWLKAHGGAPENIEVVSCDMGLAYPAGVKRNFPNAVIVFDKFHVIKLFNEAFGKYYRAFSSVNKSLADCTFLQYVHLDDFSEKQNLLFKTIQSQYSELATAYRLKETLSGMYDYNSKDIAGHYFDIWYDSVKSFGDPHMTAAAETLKSKKDNILMWYDSKINNGFAEGGNSLIQTTKRVGRGYRNVENFIMMCYLKNGKLDISF